MKTIKSSPVTSDAFSRFGVVAKLPAGAPLAKSNEFSFWSDVASFHIEGVTEIGFCTVYPHPGNEVTWMERHKRTPELLVPIDGKLVLPVMTHDRDPDVCAFEFGPGQAIVIGQDVWHSACQPVDRDQVTYFVVFRRGTPAEDVIKTDLVGVSLEITGARA